MTEEEKPKPKPESKPEAAPKPAPAAAAKEAAPPPPPPEPPKPGVFGKFLAECGINTQPMPDSTGVETLVIEADKLEQAVRLLRTSEEAKLDFLVTVSGNDNVDTIDSVYHLWSYENLNELVIKVMIKKTSIKEGQLPMVPSLARTWTTANWHERETYDLMGIRYLNHPYLRRILNPWDWDGYPLRRDYRQLVDALNDKNPHSFR